MTLFHRQDDITSLGTLAILVPILAFLIAVLVGGMVYRATRTARIGSTGELLLSESLEVYTNSSMLSSLSTFDWGTLEPADSENRTAYLYNNSSEPVTVLMEIQSWSPALASQYINVTWSHQEAELEADSGADITFYLVVSAQVQNITSFSFDIVIGEEA